MNHRGFIAVVPLIGAVIGICSLMVPWAMGYSGIDLPGSSLTGFQRFLPVVVAVLSVITALLSVGYILGPRWFIPFIAFFLGVAVLILTSVFSMWEVEGIKVVSEAGVALWMSYGSGAIVLLGSAICYKSQFRMPVAYGQ